MTAALVLVIDDDPLLANQLAQALTQESGLEALGLTSVRQVGEVLPDGEPDGVIVAVKVGDVDGLGWLAELGAHDPEVVRLVMTRVDDEEGTARVLAELGPLGHVHKPCAMADLLPKLKVGLERRRLSRELAEVRAALESRDQALAESARQVEQTTAELRTTHTELRTATERLVQAEQLAAVGRVVTGIAHELSRQLALVGYAEAIKSRVAADPELVEFADIIVHAQKRLAAMVDEIRDFAAAEGTPGSGLDREPADVAAVIDEALAILGYDRDVRARMIVRDFRARPLAALHHHKFAQVIINLVSNAVLATEPGDTVAVALDIEVSGPDGRRDEIRDFRDNGRGRHAVITVTDRGTGMPPEVVARLGEPFFTTRGDRGAGLGVGICMRIVEEHGGRLTFVSRLGEGTTARVTIPLLEPSEDP